MRSNLLVFLFIFGCHAAIAQGRLKSVIYDFDGLDIGQTSLPDGDYKNFDLDYHVSSSPLPPSDVIGDRVLQLDLNWSGGSGEFGKGISRYIELNAATDRYNFYIYNPLSNNSSADIDIVIKEDDNLNYTYESAGDDKWSASVSVPRASGWQLVSVPLSTFTDVNTGGNGIFDAGYVGNKGMVLITGITFNKHPSTVNPEQYFIDMISFSEGALPSGSSITDLPYSAGHCDLGCLAYRTPADSVPPEVAALLSPGNELRYVNIFMSYSYSGTTPSNLPGSSVQRLLDGGYRPIITWESMYTSLAPLDPAQPSLQDIINGNFDSYIDAFALKIKSYNDTIIIRPFHEFDGNWYPWAVTNNGNDPNLLKNAYRHIVDRFNAIGASKVLWAWCPNASPTPSRAYNWSVLAYPGDSYIDIVATNIYNHPIAGSPPWRSFRSVLAESYYYLTSSFPSKPFFIMELACRERYAGEESSSQTKAEWTCAMSKDLQSYFSQCKAIVFFSTIKEHDWRINSSPAALQALDNCIWKEEYFGNIITGLTEPAVITQTFIYPNPFSTSFSLDVVPPENTRVLLYDLNGRLLFSQAYRGDPVNVGDLPSGSYIMELHATSFLTRIKVVKIPSH
jgi:hypothetical protein